MHRTFTRIATWIHTNVLASRHLSEQPKRGLSGTARGRSEDRRKEVTIRLSGPDDRRGLLRLAELDSRRPPSGEALLALIDREPWAALPVSGEDPIANPFRPTAELVELLRIYGAASHHLERGRRRSFRPRMGLSRA